MDQTTTSDTKDKKDKKDESLLDHYLSIIRSQGAPLWAVYQGLGLVENQTAFAKAVLEGGVAVGGTRVRNPHCYIRYDEAKDSYYLVG